MAVVEANNCYGELAVADEGLADVAEGLRAAGFRVRFRVNQWGPHLRVDEDGFELGTNRAGDGDFLVDGIVQPGAEGRMDEVMSVLRALDVRCRFALYDEAARGKGSEPVREWAHRW